MNILDLKRKLLPLSGPQMDGGGSSSTGGGTQIQELPEWARPYAKSALEKGAALSEKPYQAYGGDRIAGFSPMQLQAQQDAANMTTNAATGAGIGIAGQAALKGLGTTYDAGKFSGGQFDSGAAQQYMNPYMQNVVDIQKREANRQAGIAAQQQQAAGVGRGAFGGSRDAMMRSEASRNLATQLGDIQAIGSSNAYQQAQQQFNADQARRMQAEQLGEQSRQYGAGLGMQGIQAALQGAGQLGALGQQQFQQGMDINKLQSAYGGQQQALRQQGLTQAYEDFQNQQNYPYKQLGFMSDLIRGLPLGQQTTRTMYEPNPSFAQQAGSLGMGMYGLSKFMADGGMAYADGGEVDSYKTGGGVDSRENVEDIVSNLKTDQDLQKALMAARARGDSDQVEAVENEIATRASLRRGIAGGITNQMAERMAADGGLMDGYAGGGVVAFAGGGLNDYMKNILDASKEDIADTPEQRLAGIKSGLPGIRELYGESALKPFAEELKKDREGLGKQREQAEGLAFLAGSQAILRPGAKSRAVADAFAAIGMGKAKADKDFMEANAKLRQSEMTLAAADQARADGQIGKAESLYDKGREDKKEAVKRRMEANEKLATIQASVDNSIRQTNASMAQINKPGETERMLGELNDIRTGKKDFQGLKGEEGVKAYQDAVGQLGAARYGVKYTGQDKAFEHRKGALELMQKDEGVKIAQMKVAQLEAKEKLSPKEQAALDANNAFLKKRYDAAMAEVQKTGGASTADAGGGKVMTMQDVLRTAEQSGKSVEEVRAAAAARGYTIR